MCIRFLSSKVERILVKNMISVQFIEELIKTNQGFISELLANPKWDKYSVFVEASIGDSS